MKLISARQAWRDAMHESRDSVMAVAAEIARLQKREDNTEKVVIMLEDENGKEVARSYTARRGNDQSIRETRGGQRLTNARCAHMLAAGLIQHAISTLPLQLQRLGHFFYSPLADGADLAAAHSLVWFSSDWGIPQVRQERAYWLALAALNSHKRLVHGKEAIGPVEACMLVQDRLGVRMHPDNWSRDWAALWERIATQIDRFDAKALAPVAAVVDRQREREKAA